MADIAAISGLARMLPGFVRSLFPTMPLNEKQKIRDCLRRIYFTPQGTLSLIEAIARGEAVDEQNDLRIVEFHENGADVNRAVTYLERIVRQAGIEYSQEFLDYLGLVYYRKFEVRDELVRFLGNLDPQQAQWDAGRAQQLACAVRDLNAAIQDIDRIL